MILVQAFLRLQNVNLARARLSPRQDRQPLNVIAGQGIIGRSRIHAAQASKFLQRIFLNVFRHTRVLDLLLQISDVLLGVVKVAKFLLNRLHLFAQVVIALRLLHRILHLGLDLVAQLLDLEFLGKVLIDPLQARRYFWHFEQFLLVGGRQERQTRRDEVREPARLVYIDRDRL